MLDTENKPAAGTFWLVLLLFVRIGLRDGALVVDLCGLHSIIIIIIIIRNVAST